ncbi:MAG: 1-phosphofructokinase family hexose kinase [Vicinamibacteraceae bacterium]
MIVVSGFNSAIDKQIEVDVLDIGGVTRAGRVQALPGGKGLHVALAAAVLGEQVCLVGCVDAQNEAYFKAFLEDRGVAFHGVLITGALRTCLAIKDREGRVTEILEAGPRLREAEVASLTSRFLECCDGADVAVLSGSLPPGFDASAYAQLGRTLEERRVPCLVDASGAVLREAVKAGVFAIKPNTAEAAALVGRPLDSVEALVDAAQRLQRQGVELVVVSGGELGAAAAWRDRTCHIAAPNVGEIRNTVGAGDCLVGGLAVGLARQDSVEDVLRLGVACGSAKLLCEETGFVRREDVERLLPEVVIHWMD